MLITSWAVWRMAWYIQEKKLCINTYIDKEMKIIYLFDKIRKVVPVVHLKRIDKSIYWAVNPI